MRVTITLMTLAALIFGGWYAWNYNTPFRNFLAEYVDNGEFLTLEARFTPQQIMETNRQMLLKDNMHAFNEPELKFHPYLLIEAKYLTPDKKTREGVLLWSLVDGEMVINTDNWEKSYGFEEALRSKATPSEFKILNALAKNNGALSKEELQHELRIETQTLAPWLESARQKHLITIRGDRIQLHIQNPKILVAPETKITQWLVTKPYNHAQRIKAKYTQNQIEDLAAAAFGSEFTIKNATEVFLPVYCIEVSNPDGSIMTSFWNALNGKQIQPKYLAENH
jgi:hypothetical protein